MSMNLRYPNITGLSEKEQLSQIKSFLHQLVDQLNYASPSDGSSSNQTYQVQGAEISYYELRSLIIQSLQKMETDFEKLSQKMTSEYVPKRGWGADKDLVTDADGNVVAAAHPDDGSADAVLYTEQTLTEEQQAQARANIGITGTGEDGQDGQDGQDGEDGISPTLTVVAITGGHRITITDVNGTVSFDVMDGQDGEDGDSGSDATVTAESIESALGYCPADDEAVSDLYDRLETTNDLVNDFNGDIGELYTRTDALAPIVSTTDITAGSAASSGRPYHVIE